MEDGSINKVMILDQELTTNPTKDKHMKNQINRKK